MKIKNMKKIIVSTMALAMGAALAGSISGTVAWYQYSTRATAAYTGASAHCSENLQIKIGTGDWENDLTTSEIQTWLLANTRHDINDTALRPVTTGAHAEDAALGTLYKNPIYQYADMATWGAASAENDYIVLPLQLRVLDVDGEASETALNGKKIYLTDLVMENKAVTGKENILPALRVHFACGTNYHTFSNTAQTVNTYGKLDLNGDGVDDKAHGYDFQDATSDVVYGVDGSQAVSLAMNDTSAIADDSDPYNISGTELGITSSGILAVTVTIYLEGWTKLGASGSESAIWNAASYIGSAFNVGFRFSAEAHANH